MKSKILEQIFRIWLQIEALDDELGEAPKGAEVPVPPIRGLKIDGRKYTLKDAVLVPESD
jgi:hypothetical protein